MNKSASFTKILLISVMGIVALPKFMFAYIDPGTGSYMLQLLIAAFIGISFAIKVHWKKIKTFISGIFKKNPGNDS